MEVFNNILTWIGEQINAILSFICVVLPDSPFKLLDNTAISEYLPYINYFVPVDFILSTLLAWLGAILIYYCYQTVMRWIRAIR